MGAGAEEDIGVASVGAQEDPDARVVGPAGELESRLVEFAHDPSPVRRRGQLHHPVGIFLPRLPHLFPDVSTPGVVPEVGIVGQSVHPPGHVGRHVGGLVRDEGPEGPGADVRLMLVHHRLHDVQGRILGTGVPPEPVRSREAVEEEVPCVLQAREAGV